MPDCGPYRLGAAVFSSRSYGRPFINAPGPDRYKVNSIDPAVTEQMKRAVMCINMRSGVIVDTQAPIDGVKSLILDHLGFDTYDEEVPPAGPRKFSMN